MSKFFLYNGVELPGLPEWDKTRYPYAFIYIVTLDGTTGVYTLVMTSSNVMSYDGNGIICTAANVGQRYTVSGEEWVAAAGSDDFYIKRDNLIFTVWANFDVLNSDGSVYVAASEPVPVAGKFPLREWVGWLIAGLCSRPLPVGATAMWETLFEGEITTSQVDYIIGSKSGIPVGYAPLFVDGEEIRLTVNGLSAIYTVLDKSAYVTGGEIGNQYLSAGPGTTIIDDGGDYFVSSYPYGVLDTTNFFTRYPGTYMVKIERALFEVKCYD